MAMRLSQPLVVPVAYKNSPPSRHVAWGAIVVFTQWELRD